MGKGSAARLKLIERNRLLLAVKLFPWSLLWLNPFYFALRLVAGAVAARSGIGDTAHFPGLRGKWTSLRLDDGSVLPTLPTFHPAYLLRTPASKRQSWSDLLALDKKLRELGIR